MGLDCLRRSNPLKEDLRLLYKLKPVIFNTLKSRMDPHLGTASGGIDNILI